MAGDKSVRVHHPMGYPPKVTQLKMAPRPESLDGKTVILVDTRFDDGDLLLKQMQGWFGDNMPSVNAVFVSKRGVYTEDDPALFERIQREADAAIVACGH